MASATAETSALTPATLEPAGGVHDLVRATPWQYAPENPREGDHRLADDVQIITEDGDNVRQHSFFCYKSKRRAEGWHRKLG